MATLPDFGAARFEKGAPIDNPYFPLTPGTIRSYSGSKVDDETGEIETESNDVFVSFDTKTIKGVETTVVRDSAYQNGVFVEDTLDWYAQDTGGNVWYLGEIAYNYRYDDEGTYQSTDNAGSWTAGKGGAKPGWIMPAAPEQDFKYYQEFARGTAEDEAEVVDLDADVSIALGDYSGVLKTLDTTALEPSAREFKYYASGFGQILGEEGLDAENNPDFAVEFRGLRTVVKDEDEDEDDDEDDDDREDDDNDDGEDADDVGDAGDGVDFTLADLTEGQRLAGVESADDPDAEDSEGNGGELYVTFLGGAAEFNNALGAYTFDTRTGRIGEGRILFDSTEEGMAGDSVGIDVGNGKGLGLFAVADGGELGVDLSAFEDGGLRFYNILSGRPASIDDGLAPLVTDAHNKPLPIQALHVLGNDDGYNLLNPAAGVHAVELESDVFGEDDETILLGFEDTRVTSPDYDGDFNDLVLAVSDTPLTEDVVESLLAELGGTVESDALFA